jgi:predicted enzyme related to lactoylglutathione lyase
MKPVPITRLALYVRDLPRIAEFYARHFGFVARFSAKRDKVVLRPAAGGCHLVLLQASKGHKIGQSTVKIIFDVPDVEAAKKAYAQQGLSFGPILRGPDYQFANARDPAKNLIQISSAYLADAIDGGFHP